MKSKKKFLLLGVGVMGALALGVGATSTFAWFQVTQSVNKSVVDETGNITATVTNPSVGSFEFVLDGLTTSDGEIDLTDEYGKSYAYIDATHKVEVDPTDPTAAFSGLTWVINYAGPSKTKEDVTAEWLSLIGTSATDHVAVQASSKAGNTHVIRFGDTGATAAQCVDGPYDLLADCTLASLSISWASDPTDANSDGTYETSVTVTSKLTKTAFDVALTALDSNEGTAAAGTHVIDVKTIIS